MKQEILESYITYIFDFFQKSRCFKAGQGNMLRNFRFAAEKQFTRNQLGILYFLVNTLIDNGYLYLKDRDFIALTENYVDVINGGECVIPKISLERTIYEKETSRSDIYEQLWNIIGSNKENDYAPLYVDGPLFYNTIRPYLTTLSLPHTYGEYMAELREKEEFTSRIKWYRTLFLALDENDVQKFLKDLSIKINRLLLMNTPKDAIQEALNPWADVDIPTIDNTPLPEILNKVAEEPIVNKNKPFVLISYAWEVEDNVFMNWIQTFAKDLRRRGIDAQIDQYQPHGTDLPKFMLESIRKATKVLCILTPKYKEKAESGKGRCLLMKGV
ncbi:toll/interleukin-1 receptor domain-containing protein [Bacteroides thetaiotaomicron]|nr:toll/interleukin-1 receptor domain-containing protein [Bacteroides thetaiotaomicron]